MENTNYSLQEKIQSFVTGDMDEGTRRQLIDEAVNDPDAADELAFSQSLARALRHREMTAAAAIIGSVIDAEGFPPPPPASTPWLSQWKTWAIGSVVLVMLSTAGYFWAVSRLQATDQEAARTALQPLENVLYIPATNPDNDPLKEGMQAYDAGRYSEAARLMADVPDLTARVYQGVSHLMSGQPRRAIEPLLEAAQSPEPPVQEAALWYLALAYYATEQPELGRQTLRRLPADGIFSTQAQELLKK
jgi:hypothetical protein